LAALVSSSASLRAEELTLDMFKGYAYLFIEGYLVQDHEMILHAIELAKEAGLQICLDMASYNIVANDLESSAQLVETYDNFSSTINTHRRGRLND
jgi:sugar/nucleoside kinase (ribokinase family)